MKKIVLWLAATLFVATLVTIISWPREIRIIPNAGQTTDGLYVMIFRNSNWERFPIQNDDRVKIGRGVWRVPTMGLCVADREKMYWEGPVFAGLFEGIEIRLNSGRTLSEREVKGIFGDEFKKQNKSEMATPRKPSD